MPSSDLRQRDADCRSGEYARVAEYTRRARQVRSRYARDPGAMHLSLIELARRQDGRAEGMAPATRRTAPPAPSSDRPSWQTPASFAQAVVCWFAGQVAQQVEGGVLRQSQRRSLLATAARVGIDRFDANLMIALAQQRGAATSAEDGRSTGGWLGLAILLLAAQLVIVGAVWRLLW